MANQIEQVDEDKKVEKSYHDSKYCLNYIKNSLDEFIWRINKLIYDKEIGRSDFINDAESLIEDFDYRCFSDLKHLYENTITGNESIILCIDEDE